jgi:hypothetical protein
LPHGFRHAVHVFECSVGILGLGCERSGTIGDWPCASSAQWHSCSLPSLIIPSRLDLAIKSILRPIHCLTEPFLCSASPAVATKSSTRLPGMARVARLAVSLHHSFCQSRPSHPGQGFIQRGHSPFNAKRFSSLAASIRHQPRPKRHLSPDTNRAFYGVPRNCACSPIPLLSDDWNKYDRLKRGFREAQRH